MILQELSKNILAEMANIRPKYHKAGVDIKFQIGQPGIWTYSGHGPRVKLFNHNSRDNSIIISLDKNISNIKLIEDTYNRKILKMSQVNDLIEYFKKYRFVYLIMWLDPDRDVDDLVDMLEQVDRDPMVIETQFMKYMMNDE